jgi:prepilin-type N-terminal cleavage/methylation domain-containing protein
MKQILSASPRAGVSLIELIVVMSAASIILSLSAGLIHRAMHAETRARNLAAVERTSLRLSAAVRRDIHSAVTAATDSTQLADGIFLRLDTSTAQRIEYRRDGRAIHRLQFEHDAVVAREQFAFPSDFNLQMRSETPALLTFTLTSPRLSGPPEPEDAIQIAKSFAVNLQVVAALRGGAP